MALQLDGMLMEALGALRIARTRFRIRGFAGPEPVVDSRAALLVWEPRRVTPVYAVPRADVRVPVETVGPPRPLDEGERRRPVLDPSVPFAAHTAPGRVVALRTPTGAVDGFMADDPDLADHVLVDFDALAWWEEDQEVFAHPRDPFQRIDVRPSRSRLELLRDGVPLVDTTRAVALWEHLLPVRWYVPRDEVRVPLEPSGTTSWCAYKGRASYWTAVAGGSRLADVAWSYEQPLSDAVAVRGMVAFYAERLEARLDGEPLPPPRSPGA